MNANDPSIHIQYFVFLHRPGPAWLEGKPITEQPLAEHFRYMDDLESSGQLVLGGGFLDSAGAMGVLKVGSLGEAQSLLERDPAVKNGIVVTEVHPWFVTVAGEVRISRT
jgi:uncharacterized protein YciI